MSFVGVVMEPLPGHRVRIVGSCFAFLEGSHFVTADHVIEAISERGAETIHVAGPDGTDVAVDVVGRHPKFDLAVLRARGASVEPFRPAAAHIDGRAELIGFSGGKWAAKPVTVDGSVTLPHTSTAASRGTSPAPEDARTMTYSYPALAFRPAHGRGFSGGPLVCESGALGVHTASWGRDGHPELGLAVELAAALPWLRAVVQHQHGGVPA